VVCGALKSWRPVRGKGVNEPDCLSGLCESSAFSPETLIPGVGRMLGVGRNKLNGCNQLHAHSRSSSLEVD
jgi:hypothetical protein